MDNKQIANIFRKIAEILELQGAIIFRIRAYERAADTIERLGAELKVMAEQDTLTTLSGIGKDLSDKIKEIVETGSLKYYGDLKKEVPEGLLQMLKISGLGPKTVKLINDNLKINTIEGLEKAAREGELRKIEGIREKTEENILRGIDLFKKREERTLFYKASDISDKFIEQLKKMKEIDKIESAGSLRRKKWTVKDIDILVTSKQPEKVIDTFVKLSLVSEVLAKGSTKSSVIAKDSNLQVDLRVLEASKFGSALMHFTGSKEFNVKLRQLAIKKGYKVSEYGLFSVSPDKKEELIAGQTEDEIFSRMELVYIPPELREDRGEIEAAQSNKLPELINIQDIRGDLHVHSTYSDGKDTIEIIAQEAKRLGYRYIGISDHSQSLRVANGMSIENIFKKIEEIKKLNKSIKGIEILCGTEVDILPDGTIDYPDSVLKELDFCIAAVHSGFKQTKEKLTKRIVSACKNKYINIIAHPTGVLWGVREECEIDFDEVLKAALDNDTALEINCHPMRGDLNSLNILKARRAGVKIAIGSDAHIISELKFMDLGVNLSRRGWLEKNDIINCMEVSKLEKWLQKKQ